MKRILALGVMCCSLSSMAAVTEQIRYGVEPNYAPFEYKTQDGKLAGFDIDIGHALCEKMKIQCSWVEVPFDALIAALDAKKFDVINSDFSATAKRAQIINFSHMLYDVSRRLVARNGSNLQPTPASLRGKTIGVTQGTIEEIFIKKHWVPQGVNIQVYQNQDLAYADLVNGRVDALLQGTQSAETALLSRPQGKDFGFSGPPVIDEETLGKGVSLGFRKEDTALLQRFNQAIAELHADGTIEKISRNYFKEGVIFFPHNKVDGDATH
ncbi:lysine/arginine/ornithine transport system substrate-binding protein [Raoultella sp. BIGb0138]|uniref:transporter substrate-binding domain-containing protein n=1 Tax=Raoultella sp. BIGb0138 TaxID=2485115 RepID=UPI0010E1EB24|nr:transporter substrate-binding domain-containing protein [Raoultella sp. BIGb0138]TCW16622.1 lysine/arginine/ornithine transport system substrate-binding protein [Raoultella sp. BIGb0138]